MKPKLDHLLETLRDATPDHPRLPELERLLGERMAHMELPLFWRRFGFHIRVTAVLGAFLWGILMGSHGTSMTLPARSGELLVDPPEFLAPSGNEPRL